MTPEFGKSIHQLPLIPARRSSRPADRRNQALDSRKLPSHKGPFPKYIVHGHTPTIYLDPQQTNTGAGVNGPLSAAIFNDRQAKPIQTIRTGAEN
jgi:hypothetical protein